MTARHPIAIAEQRWRQEPFAQEPFAIAGVTIRIIKRVSVFFDQARRKLRRLDRRLVLSALAIAVLGGAMIVAAFEELDRKKPAPRAVEPPAQAEAPAKTAERTQTAVLAERLASGGRDLSLLPSFDMTMPFTSVSGTSLMRGTDIIQIDGVQGPSAGEICIDDEGARWACGLQARAALHNLLSDKSLTCHPRRSVAPGVLAAQCRLRNRDLSPGFDPDLAELIVERGWARPDVRGAVTMGTKHEQARLSKAGLWRGGWFAASPERN